MTQPRRDKIRMYREIAEFVLWSVVFAVAITLFVIGFDFM